MKYAFLALSWFFGCMFALLGLVSLTESWYEAAALFAMALLLLPPVREWVYTLTHVKIHIAARLLLLVGLFIAFGMFASWTIPVGTSHVAKQIQTKEPRKAAVPSIAKVTSDDDGVMAPGPYYVTATNLNVRLAPGSSGKVTNTLHRRDKVEVREVKDGWARISRFYNGNVEGVSGQVARWVSAQFLSITRPAAPKVQHTNSPVARAIKGSDDFAKYHKAFLAASTKLVSSGSCTIGDFKEMGGWLRSPSYKPKPVYFTYCGGFTKANRIYLNVATGKVFR